MRRATLALAALALAVLGGCTSSERSAGDLYREQCARCHGGDGKGDKRSIALYPNLDLTSSRMILAGTRARGLVYRRIAEGYGGMPGFADRLESGDIERLVAYVLRLPQGKTGR